MNSRARIFFAREKGFSIKKSEPRPGFPVVLTLASLIPITKWAIHAAYALADVKVYARGGHLITLTLYMRGRSYPGSLL